MSPRSLVPLGFTEIRRRRSRYALLTAAIAFLVLLLLFLITIFSALLGAFTGAIENQSADVLVYSDVSRRNIEASRLPATAVAAVARVPGVRRAAPLYESAFTVARTGGAKNVTVIGFAPGGPGAPSEAGVARPAPGEALVDSANASDYPVGSTIRFRPSGLVVRVVGTATNAGLQVQPTFWVPPAGYRDLVDRTYPGARDVPVSLVAVSAEPGVDAARVAAEIGRRVAGTEALTRSDAVAAIPGVAPISASFALIAGGTAAIVVVVVGFFFVIFTVQKLPALGAMRAVGASVWYLGRVTMGQIAAVVLAAFVLATGALAGLLATLPLSLPTAIQWGAVAATGGAVLAFSLLAGLVSVRRIARLDPAAVAQGRHF